ncbi:MAG: response regulator [Planctomycetota bacterium]|jgi:signal transduction histidine kinase/CheY-like chemotaxis protein|nr:response regulator [Planctomycetota bacterium]
MEQRPSIADLYAGVARTLRFATLMALVVATALVAISAYTSLRVVETSVAFWLNEFEHQVTETVADLVRGDRAVGAMYNRMDLSPDGVVLRSEQAWMIGASIARSPMWQQLQELEPGGTAVGLWSDPADRVRRLTVGYRHEGEPRISVATYAALEFLPRVPDQLSVLLLDQSGTVVVDPQGRLLGDAVTGAPVQWVHDGLIVQAGRSLASSPDVRIVARVEITTPAVALLCMVATLLGLASTLALRGRQLGRRLSGLGAEQGRVTVALEIMDSVSANDQEPRLSEMSDATGRAVDSLSGFSATYAETEQISSAVSHLGRRWQDLVLRVADVHEALGAREQELRGIFDAAVSVGLVLVEDGCVCECSRGAELLFARAHDDLVGHALKSLVHPDDCDLLAQCMAVDDSSLGADLSLMRGNESIPGRVDCYRMPGPNRQVLIVCQDLSERRELEEQLNWSRKMDAVGQLAGGVAHDFNNMLAGISGYAELLSLSAQLTEDERRSLERIVALTEQAARLTQQLLAFSRKATMVHEAVSASDLLNDTVALLRRTLDKSVVIDLAPVDRDLTLHGDRSLIQNALINLAFNARDAMPDGGALRMRASLCDFDSQRAAHARVVPGQYCHIEVSDTGSGIPIELLPSIFDPFFTTKELGKGTGLGLAAVYGTVVEHGGAVEVRSEPGQGAIFDLWLPVVDKGAIETSVVTAGLSPGCGVVLVIDDEADVRRITVGMLEALGYDTAEAENGEEALEMLPDLGAVEAVLLDLVMPRLGGAETLAGLRERCPEVPVVIVSGHARDTRINTLIEQGARAFLAKPFRLGELSAVLSRVIGGLEDASV